MRRPAAFSQAWWLEWGLSAMLVFLVLALFVALPLEAMGIVSQTLVGIILTFLFVAGVVAMAGRGWLTAAAAGVAVASVSLRWAVMAFPSRALKICDIAVAMLALGFLTAFVLAFVFRAGRITMDRVRGAIVVYLLLGVLFSLAYQLIDFLWPGAFQLAVRKPPEIGRLDPEMVYYSFVTLTTVGYGDVTPVFPLARMLAVGEALIGQLYPAILIARLVSLQIAHEMADTSK